MAGSMAFCSFSALTMAGKSDKPSFLAISKTLPKAEGFSNQFQDMSVMRDTVEQGSGETFITQYLNPIGELEIGGQDESQAFIDF